MIKIRNAGIDDAKQIASIQVNTWKFAYKDFMPEDFLNSLSTEERTEKWKENLAKCEEEQKEILVSVEKDKVLGFSAIGPEGEEKKSNIGELYSIYVNHEKLHEGIGSILMKEALTRLKKKNYKKAILWVVTGNERAEKFYVKNGWKKTNDTKVDDRGTFKIYETKYEIDLNF